MAEIGRMNRLTIKVVRDDGAYLDGGESGELLLPTREVPAQSRPGDAVEVFVFMDREKRLRATSKKPLVTVGQFACLRVVVNSPAGAYLHWGMPKDLLVPKREQQEPMVEGRSYVVHVFIDEQARRITASTKLDKFLDLQIPNYAGGDEVDLIIYDKTDLGYKAIVDHSFGGVIYANEVFQELQIGQELKGYIKKIRDDLKIDLSLQRAGYQRVDDVSQGILDILNELGGLIAVTDKSPPEEIYALFRVSKKTFKKAIGALYKKRLITIGPNGIKLAK
jgi:hypothetical protein